MSLSLASLNDIPMPMQMKGILSTINFLDVIDILIVAFILYKLYEMLQDTRAITIVKGLMVLSVLTLVSSWLELHVIFWLLQKTLTLLFVALPIVFQPELRRTLEHLGQGRFFGRSVFLNDEEAQYIVSEIDRAVMQMAKDHTGALIVIEKEMGLNDVSVTGIQIDGLITADFMLNVFIPNTPLHDGAAIIRGKRMIAAGCLLPLTDDRSLSTELGTRHRAAIGLSEQCDAVIIVVSEETGTVSIAENGRLYRHLDSGMLKARLAPLFMPKMTGIKEIVANWRKKK